ncbi:glycosyltransferase [uncultured Acinetobacter sp.]|uniref:glycosyltransferase n=1 Tax=uncultured Acinetobacter sp. TaxID=165433 RepID=UPI0025854748|nr:glycosyltransferase [uncultured Acinetobacter sp.]
MSTDYKLFMKLANDAFKSNNFELCLSYLTQAIIAYPEHKKLTEMSIDLVKSHLGLKKFGWAYDAKVKEVPEKPKDFPDYLTLPPLKGVANDYTFIEDEIKKFHSSGKKLTRNVSIVIPVYNRSIELDFVLAGLTHQTYPLNLIEVIIADDGSQEDLSLVYNKYKKYFKIIYCKQEDLGYRLAEARNLGISNASYDDIIILDSDAIPSPCLVEEYMKIFHVNRNVAIMGLRHYVSVANVKVKDFIKNPKLVYNLGSVKSENTSNTRVNSKGESIDWREAILDDTDNLKKEALPYRFLVGANCGFTKEVFNKVNGYCEEFNAWGFEDQEFGYRLYNAGVYFYPLRNAYVYHQEPLAGKNDTDRQLGAAITKDIYIQKCPFIYRRKSNKKGPFEAPLVSIYIPLYNREKYIVECVQSALEQTITDLEVVICDDGSTDRSVEVVKKYFSNDPRVRLIQKENGGISSSSNVAVRACRGTYIGQLDADDVLKRNAVDLCLKEMEKNHKLSLVYATTEYIDQDSNVFQQGWNWPVFSREYLLTKMICHHFRFFRMRDWQRTSGFDESLKNAVDYDMMLKLAEKGEVLHLNKVLYQYRKHTETTTTQDNGLQTMNNFICINNALGRLGINNLKAVEHSDLANGVERTVNFIRQF